MTFPEVLDLNHFITTSNIGNKDSEGEEMEEDKTVLPNGQVDSSDEGMAMFFLLKKLHFFPSSF